MRSYPMEFIDAKHYLTQEERNDMGFSLSEKHIEISNLTEEKKGVVANYTAKIDQRKAEISLLSTNIANGYVMLSLHAEKRRNYKERMWEWWDTNTGEIVKTKPFEGSDFQLRTDDVEEPEPEQPVEDVQHTEALLLGSGEAESVEYQDVDNDPSPDGGNDDSNGGDEDGEPKGDQEESDEDRELNKEVDELFGIATETTDYPKNVNFPIVDEERKPVEKKKAGRPKKQ